MKISPVVMVSALLLSGMALSNSASADHSWNGYHWARTSSSFTLKVVDSVTPDWDGEFGESLGRWSVPSLLDLTVASTDDGKRTRKRCRSVNGQMRVCNDSYGRNGWLGMASINLDSDGHIVRGVAKMNDTYSSYWTPEEKNHVMCQEIGHVLGLGHTSEDGSSQATCMDYSDSPYSQWPNGHDYDLLVSIYGHWDGYDSYDTDSGGGGGGGACNAPPGKGCNKNQAGEIPPMGVRVHQGRDFEIWVAPGERGTTWIHHVTLVPEVPHAH